MAEKIRFYIGTYTEGIALPEALKDVKRGIYCAEFSADTGELRILSVTEGVQNPSYLIPDFTASDESCGFVYAVNESGSAKDGGCGGVSSFRTDRADGALTLISRVSSLGVHPCYLALNQQKRRLFAANYTSGNGCHIAVAENGILNEPVEIPAHPGKGIHPERQQQTHAHAAFLDKQERRLLLTDLGLDKLFLYDYDDYQKGAAGKAAEILHESMPASYAMKCGCGPRHGIFDETGRFLYVIGELSSEITVLGYHAETGTIELLQTISTLPQPDAGNTGAAIRLTPDGSYLYASNRGADNFAVYERDGSTGLLKLLRWEPALGKTPRDFAVSPSGNYLIAANQDSHNVVVFEICRENGALQKVCERCIPAPVCIAMIAN